MMEKWGDGICHDALHSLVSNAMTMDIEEQKETLFLGRTDPTPDKVMLRMLDDIVDAGLNVDQKDDDGCTPLMRLLGTNISSRKLKDALPLRHNQKS